MKIFHSLRRGVEISTVLFLVGIGISTGAWADVVQARSVEECAVFADVAVVSRALRVAGISEEIGSSILGTIYRAEGPRAKLVVGEIARASLSAIGDPRVWGDRFLRHCLENEGRMDAFLGRPA